MADDISDDNAIAVEENHSITTGNASSSIESLLFHATMEEFEQVCNTIKISNDLKRRSKDLLQTVYDADIFHTEPKMTNSEIFASILYMVVIDARVPYGDSEKNTSSDVTVTDILLVTNLNINNLFRTLLVIGEKVPLSEIVQLQFTNMKRKYCVMSAIFHTFQSRLCSAVFREETNGKSREDSLLPPIPETEGVAYRKKLAWVLFLLAKHKMLSDSLELFEHFQLLLCSLEYVLRNTPSFLLNSPYDSIRFGYYNSKDESQTMLGRLASDFDVDLEDTQDLRDRSTEPFFQKLLNCDGELDCDRLCEKYLKVFKREGDLNELLFLSKNSLLVPLQSAKLTNPSNGHSKLLPQEMTPVKVAVSAVQQLNLHLSEVKEEAGSKLLSFYHKCEPDPSVSIRHLVSDLKERFLTRYQSENGFGVRSTIGMQRWSLGVKLYQKVLETMVITESERLPLTTLSVLLSKEEFHKSMIACSLEVVLATYGQSWNQSVGSLTPDNCSCIFPWVLDVLDLQAYDFYKVVESFIKAEPTLSSDIVKHLQNLENRILDNLAWKEGSTLFDALGRCDAMPIIPLPLASSIRTPGSGLTPSQIGPKCSVELFLSPMRPTSSIVPPSPLASSTPSPVPIKQEAPSSEGSRQPAASKSQSLTHFLSRVTRLGFYRLTKLCSSLNISKDIEHKIWTCFEFCITKGSGMLKNRHLDQILMCCIYGICKVVEHELLFKTIVSQYKTLPNFKQEVYKNVYIMPEEFDSIIGFYNRVFIQNMESYIKQFGPNRQTPPLSPKPKQAIPSPTYSLPGKKNFYVSPLKQSLFKAPGSPSQVTPSKRMLYSFGETIGAKPEMEAFVVVPPHTNGLPLCENESLCYYRQTMGQGVNSSEKLSVINEKVSAAKKRKMSVNKCLNFDSCKYLLTHEG